MKKSLFLFSLSILPLFTFGQGLNNNYTYDQTDISKLFEMNHMEVYKFKIPYRADSNGYNIVFYYYQKGKLVDSFNYLNKIKEQIPDYRQFALLTQKTGDNLLRFYIKEDTNQTSLEVELNGATNSYVFPLHEKTMGSRAMISNSDLIDKKTRILTVYGINNDGIMHCAMEDSDEKLKKRMDGLIVIYLIPIGKVEVK